MRLLYDIVMAQGQRLDQHHELLQDHGALLETHQKQIVDFERTSRYYVSTLMSFLNQQVLTKCFSINLGVFLQYLRHPSQLHLPTYLMNSGVMNIRQN